MRSRRSCVSGEPTAILIGGTACRERSLELVSRISVETGAKVLCETFPARLTRGAGVPAVDRIAYLAEFAAMQLDGLAHLVLVDAKAPVSFFAYPDKASYLVPDGCDVHVLADPSEDAATALEALAEAVGATSAEPVRQTAERPDRPTGALTAETVCRALGALLPENARDDDSLPRYEILDPILEGYVEQDLGRTQLLARGFDPADVDRVIRLVDLAEYKRRQMPPGVKITTRAFGRDRRLPITNRFGG